MRFLGIDLHPNSFTVACQRVEDEKMNLKVKRYVINIDRKSFQKFLDSLEKDDYVLVESTSNAFWFHDQVRSRVKECYVYNTNEARNKGNKSDKIDAKELSEKLLFYVAMGGKKDSLPTVYVPEEEVRALHNLVTGYQFHNKIKNQLRNRIYAILVENGIPLKKKEMDKKDFESRINAFNIPSLSKYQLHLLLRDVKSKEKEVKELKDTICMAGLRLFKDEVTLLLSIRGFSILTASVFMSDVVDVSRFSKDKQICSYLRTAPRVKSSNNTTHIGAVNKQSRSATCTILTQSVIHLREAGDHISGFYERVKKGKSPGKSRIAVIRKIIVAAFHMLKKNEKYYWTEERLYNKKLKDINTLLKKMEKIEVFYAKTA